MPHPGPVPAPRVRLSALALLLLASSGCPSKREQAKAEAQGERDAYEPLAAEPGRFVSGDGRISVPLPPGEGWECLEESHGEAEAAAVAVRCRRQNPREFMFFAAKTHRQPVDQRVDAETVLMSLYRADNEAFFDTVEYQRDGPATLAGARGWESELAATHARLGKIRKRERLAIVGDRVFAISAEGQPALWDAHAEALEAWFADVRFAR